LCVAAPEESPPIVVTTTIGAAQPSTTQARIAATQRADLLAAVMDEIDRLWGSHDDAADDLINATLPPGVQRFQAAL
jgi:hypothetical protein